MTNLTTTRRALLASAPVAALAVSIPAAAVTARPRAKWDAAMATYNRAIADQKAFDPVWDRVNAEWLAGRPSMDSIHWKEFAFADRNHVARSLDLDKEWQHFLEGENKWWSAGTPAGVEKMKQRRRAALDSVQAFRDAEAKNDRESGMDEADRRSDELSDRYLAADRALMEMPAPDLAALAWKLEVLLEVSNDSTSSWSEDYTRQTRADIVRLCGEAG